jgi:hypothetical protein
VSLRTICEAVAALPSSIAIRESIYGYPILLTSHVVGMSLFAGMIAMMDLRLAGLGNLSSSCSDMQKRLFPWQMLGVALSFSTGILLVFSDPMRFYGNFYFWLKNVLLVLALVNAVWFHRTTYQSVEQWDDDPVPPVSARVAGFISLGLWAAIIIFGRMIAYSGLVPAWWKALKLS